MFFQLHFVLGRWFWFSSFPLHFAQCKNNHGQVVMISASLQIRSGSCVGVNQHSSDFYKMTKSDLLAGFCPCALLLEGGCLHPPLRVAVAMAGPAAPLPSSPQLSCLQSSYPDSVKMGLAVLVAAKSLMLTLLKQRKKIQKILSSSLCPAPQFGAKESLSMDITIPTVGVDLYHWNPSVDSSFVSFSFLTHFIFSVLRFVRVQKTNISFCT